MLARIYFLTDADRRMHFGIMFLMAGGDPHVINMM
jgi:hypothetical protein